MDLRPLVILEASTRHSAVLASVLLSGFMLAAPCQAADGANKPASPQVAKSAEQTKPAWKTLTPAQQTALQPLSAGWDGLSEGQKRKWIAVAKSYPTLSAAEQGKLHSRMREWAALSASQRAQARFTFAETAKLTPAEKSATWQAYQALPEAEKQKLAAKAAAQPSGAAPAISPTAPRKLASVPLPRQPAASSAKMAASSHAAEHTGPTSPSQPAADAPGIHKN